MTEFNERESYQQQRPAADLHLPQQMTIVAKLFGVGIEEVVKANDHLDMKEATDVVVFGVNRVSLRIRDHKWYEDKWTDFTLREAGSPSERQKVEKGFGDWMLYGFKTPDLSSMMSWSLIDLDVFRAMSKDVEEGELSAEDAGAFLMLTKAGQNNFFTINMVKAFEVRGYEFIRYTTDPRLVLAPHTKLRSLTGGKP